MITHMAHSFFFHCLVLNPMFSTSWIYSFNKHLALTCTYGPSIVIGTEQKMPAEKQTSKWKNTVPALQTLTVCWQWNINQSHMKLQKYTTSLVVQWLKAHLRMQQVWV